MRYKALLIDNDETLMDFHAAEGNAIAQVNAFLGIDDPSAREHYSAINAKCWLDYEKGQITQEEVKVRRFREYLALYGVDAKPEEVTERYADALAEQCILLDGALDVLKAVSTKMPIALVTNGIGRVQRRRLEKGNLWGYFQAVIISQEVGAQKPEPQMVFAALKALGGIAPEDALLCGDSLTSDILAANRAGVDACWYNPRHKAKPADLSIRYEIDDIRKLIDIALAL